MAPPKRTASRLPLAALLASALLTAAPAGAQDEGSGEHGEIDAEEDGVDGTDLDEPDAALTEPGAAEEAAPQTTGHGGQFGLRVGIVGGYRMMFRYADSPFCGAPSENEGESCFYGAPAALDLALGYALFDSLELFGWARLGLGREDKTDTDAVRALGAGIRVYTMSDAPLKIFVQPAVALSFEGGGGRPDWRARGGTVADYRSDLLFHFSVGPQYDFNRHFGAYAGAGMTVGALRAMSANLEATFGLQGRYP